MLIDVVVLVDPDLRPARQARRQRLARAGAADAVLASGLPETLRITCKKPFAFSLRAPSRSTAPTSSSRRGCCDEVRSVVARTAADHPRPRANRFGDNEVLRGIDLHIPAGQFVAIVGRSGCGKSTLLRLIAGLETSRPRAPSASARTARPEDVRVMFQEPRLLPWARVLSNVEVGLGRDAQVAGRAGARRSRAGRGRPRRQARRSGRRCCPADRSSAWRWPARWSASRACWPSTSRSARSTR